jgi:hypothetical protein
MPIPKPLSDLKKEIEELIQIPDLAKAIKYLQGLLPDGSEKRTQTILLESRLGQANKAHLNGQIEFKDQQLVSANVVAAILDLTNSLSESDFELKGPGAGPASTSAVPKFVVIYAPEDEQHCKMLNRHLNVLKLMKKIRVYNVNETLGSELVAQAKAEMADADYLLVLITVNLFNATDWFEVMYNALGEGRRMIPLRIEKADFEGTGLEKLKSLPSMGKAVSDYSNADSAYAEIVGELKKLLPK